MNQTVRSVEIWTTIAIGILGAAGLLFARNLPASSQLIPNALGVLMIFVAGIQTISLLRTPVSTDGGAAPQDSEDAGEMQSDYAQLGDRDARRRIFLIVGATAALVAVVPFVGYAIGVGLYMAACMRFFAKLSVVATLLTGLVSFAVVYALFEMVLGLPPFPAFLAGMF